MTLWFIRLFFVALSAVVGYQIGGWLAWGTSAGAIGTGIGIGLAVSLIGLEYSLKKV